MAKKASARDNFYLWYGIIDGLAIILAIAAWLFWHGNLLYLLGSLIIIAIASGTIAMARALSSSGQRDE